MIPQSSHIWHDRCVNRDRRDGRPGGEAAQTETDGADLSVVTALNRAEQIKRRRLALGIKSLREFAKESGISREALTAAEDGTASAGTVDRVEAWLTQQEEENGHDDSASAGEPLRMTLRGVYGIAEIVVEAPVDHPEELAEAVSRILERFGDQK